MRDISGVKTSLPLTKYGRSYVLPPQYFLVDDLVPTLPTKKQNAFTINWTKEKLVLFNTEYADRAARESFKQTLSQNTFTVPRHLWSEDVSYDDKDEMLQDGWTETEIREDMVRTVKQVLATAQQKRFMDMLFDVNTTYSTPIAAVGSAWSDTVNGDPEGDIYATMDLIWGATGLAPTDIIVDYKTMNYIKAHPQYIDWSKRGQGSDWLDQFSLNWHVIKSSYFSTFNATSLTSMVGGKALIYFKPAITPDNYTPAYVVKTSYKPLEIKIKQNDYEELETVQGSFKEGEHMVWASCGYILTGIYS